ncbi:extracellular solute-binding protein [Cohnella herbarum]|uniref:Extracellular solute-binding protein n=1 Tax=Cohnella herbarum TaxID=2728023 RepID=A0A7Z2VQE5_9BACL|nr:extracellular solute-binding protein [Cohnella herbarum]QJD87387.1 extracellular solute-binding protein [Cohnella herbarum]
MRSRKALLVSVAVLMVLTVILAGCAGKNNNGGNQAASNASSPPSASSSEAAPSESASEEAPPADIYEVGKEPLEFSFYGHYDWYSMPKWGEDAASKWIKENKKVNITAVQSANNAKQKLNTMMAANDLPDVIWADRHSADIKLLIESDMLVPFDDYIDKYPNLKKWLSTEAINMLRSDDGKLYQFPNWYTNQPNGNAGYVVNKKIYKELGSPKLETTDDLYEYLKAVKSKYSDVVPFEPELVIDGQGLDVLYTAFQENALNRWVGNRSIPKDGKMTSVFEDTAFRESMQFAAKLFREKLMTQDALTQTRDQVKEKVLNGKVAVYASSSPTDFAAEADGILSKSDPDAGYFVTWPIAKPGLDKNKIFPGTYSKLGWNVSVITKAAENPEAIFAFLDWYTGPEGQRVLMWGPEGGYWNGLEDDGITPIFTEKYASDKEGLAKLQADSNNIFWNGNTVFLDTTKAKYESTLPMEQRNWNTHYQYEVTWKTQADATEYSVNMLPSKDSEAGIATQAVEDIFDEYRAKALYGKNDDDVLKILDEANEKAFAVGYQKQLDYQTEAWQANVKKMNGN